MRSPTRPSRRFTRWTARAAFLAALLLLVAALLTVDLFRRPQTFRTDVGAFRRIPLDDGSTIELNTNTVVRVVLTKQSRRVTLLQGEAHFDVEADLRRPFVVHAGNTVVRVVGTAFGVRMYDATHTAVLVTKGRVAMSTGVPDHGLFRLADISDVNESIVSAGEQAMHHAGRITIYTLEPEEVVARQAWRHGSMLFADRPLSEIVAELNRYNDEQLKILDPSIADIRLSGQLALRGTRTFLVVLAKSHGILAREIVGRTDVIELRRADEP